MYAVSDISIKPLRKGRQPPSERKKIPIADSIM